MNRGRFTSTNSEWTTPQDLFDRLNQEFNFTLDPCATSENAKCSQYFTKQEDGLSQNWGGHRVFMNPPYGAELPKWMEKARTSGAMCVCLVPARTDTRWWHNNVEGKAKVRFIKGRLRFGGSKWNAPFASVLVIYEHPDLLK